jgi:hypothetical protein
MKKVSFVFAVFLFITAGKLYSQNVTMTDVMISSVKITDGKNTIRVPNDKGTIQLVKRGDKFSDVVYTDAAGKATRLASAPAGTNGLPKPACKFPLPDACFGIPNSSQIGMCICRPTDITSGEEYSISLLLPAVQAAREAARRAQ